MNLTTLAISSAEHGYLPDAALRAGIRRLLKKRLQEIAAADCEASAELESRFVAAMRQAPIAPLPELANQQHYELPAEFFTYCLGKHRKYSSCFWNQDTQTLDQAEELALSLTCEHAGLQDGQQILELGCGWGSLTLWMAQRFPDSKITAVSNSASQRAYILAQAAERKLGNLEIITCDMNVFAAPRQYDRIVSVEMFEHMRNYRLLYGKVHDWLRPGGRFFKHIFVHRLTPYAFEVAGEDDWMSQFFFSGGMMPSDDLPLRFQEKLKLVDLWRWNGTHYQKTANAWLANLDANADAVHPILAQTYGEQEVDRWRMRWRIFYLSCAELFGFNHGQEWWVTHYLFERPA